MRNMICTVVTFIFCLSAGTLCSEELPRGVQRILKDMDKSIEKSLERHYDEVEEITRKVIPELEEELVKETKKGDLKSALAVEEKIKELKSSLLMRSKPEFFVSIIGTGTAMVSSRKLGESIAPVWTNPEKQNYMWTSVPDELKGKTYSMAGWGVGNEETIQVKINRKTEVFALLKYNPDLELSISKAQLDLEKLGFKERQLKIECVYPVKIYSMMAEKDFSWDLNYRRDVTFVW
jgi:hypothetical protein